MSRSSNVLVWFVLTITGAVSAYGQSPAHAPWQKRVALDQSGKPWPDVLKWLAGESKLPLVTLAKVPTGKFVFVDPDNKTGKTREYTLLQIYDILNRDLRENHLLTIVRSDVAITVAALPVQEIPGELIRRVELDELDGCGETETVEFVFRLWSGHSGEEWADKLKPMLGPYAYITPVSSRLIVRADVATIRDLAAILQAARKNNARDVDWLTKRYAFAVQDKPWREVVGWLASQAEVPYTRPPGRIPAGRFTFVNPKDEKGNPRMYSLAEIFYILDDHLREDQQLRILHLDISLATWPVDWEVLPHFKVMNPPRPSTELRLPQPSVYCEPLPRCRPGLLGRLFRR